MRFSKAAPALVGAMFVMSAPTLADTKADIQGLYNQLCTAFKKGDIEGVKATAAPDFTLIEHGQKMNAEQALQQLKMMFASGMKISKMEMTVRSVKAKGNTAVVRADSVSEGTMKMPDGKVHKMESVGVSSDTLVKTPAGWKFQIVKSVSEKSKMDGKPFDPAKMMGGAPPKGKK